MKDELVGKIIKEFAALRAKIYSNLTDTDDENKKTKGTKNCVVKGKFKAEDYLIICLKATQLDDKMNHLE